MLWAGIGLIVLELFADKGACKAFGVKGLQVVDCFAYADEVNRQWGLALGSDGHQYAAFGGAVKFGDDKAGETGVLIEGFDLRQCVLAVGTVHHQKHFSLLFD